MAQIYKWNTLFEMIAERVGDDDIRRKLYALVRGIITLRRNASLCDNYKTVLSNATQVEALENVLRVSGWTDAKRDILMLSKVVFSPDVSDEGVSDEDVPELVTDEEESDTEVDITQPLEIAMNPLFSVTKTFDVQDATLEMIQQHIVKITFKFNNGSYQVVGSLLSNP